MAAMDPSAPSKLPPPGTESTCEPIMIGFRRAPRSPCPGRVARMLPAASMLASHPACRISFMTKARPAISASD